MESETFIKIVEAISYFNANDINNLIIDLRFNLGGNDLMAAVVMGLFFENESFYEYITGPYDIDYEVLYTLWVVPIKPQYNGNIVTLIDPNCISTGRRTINDDQAFGEWEHSFFMGNEWFIWHGGLRSSLFARRINSHLSTSTISR